MPAKLLFVDDDAVVLEAAVRMFSDRYIVITAPNGREALETMKCHQDICVVVSDLSMPGMCGFEFLKKAATLLPKATKMMLTSSEEHELAIRAVEESNVFYFLNKPCSPQMLVKSVDSAVELQTLERKLAKIKAGLRRSAASA